MTIKLSDIQNKTRTIEVAFQGGTLEIDYRLNVITPAFLRSNLPLHEQLGQTITHWGLTDDDGKELPVSAEVLDALSVQFQSEVMKAITADMRAASEDEKKA
jgi:hypothetical protein